MTRRTIANVLAERLKQRYGQAFEIEQTRQRALKVLSPAVKDIRAVKDVLREAVRVLDAIDVDIDALIGVMREDEEIAAEFLSKFAADTTLILNWNSGFVKNDPNLIAQMLEVAETDTLGRAFHMLEPDEQHRILKVLQE